MAKFVCSKCNKERDILEYSIKVAPEGLVSDEAVCCQTYMDRIDNRKGFGGIKKGRNGSVKGKYSH